MAVIKSEFIDSSFPDMYNSSNLLDRLILHFVVFSAIALTGMEYFFHFREFLIIFFGLITFLFFKKSHGLNIKAFCIIGIFLLLELIQGYFYFFSIETFIASLIRLLFAYFVVALTGRSFVPVYIHWLYIFSVISLLVYPTLFIPGVSDFYINVVAKPFFPLFDTSALAPNEPYLPNMVLYNFNPTVLFPPEIRNSGPFWEPGAFAVFLILALIFNTMNGNSLLNKKNIVFILAILTTVSTAGILAAFLYIVGFVFFKGKITVAKTFSVALLLVLGIVMFFSLPFLYEKIIENISLAPETTGSRFGSALADIYYITQNPFIGYGRITENIFGFNTAWSQEMHRNNGVTDVFVRLGLIVGLLFFIILFKSLHHLIRFYNQPRSMNFILSFTIILVGFSQLIFNKPIFLCLLFLFIPYSQLNESVKQ